ncbi:MAG TPA: conjugal transfer protein TraG, partial [Aigarchaeota archaeon]|nr:conjugal transfer protein TraG [Aigarchaeota archaeon]
MLNFEIYTVGGIDFLMPVFRALVTFLGGNAVASFVKLFVISGLFFAVWISIFGKDKLFFVKHFLMAVFLVNLSFAPIANLTIIDTKYNRIESVSNFPFLPGLFLSIGSVSADFFTNAIDSLFHTGTTVVWSGGSGSYLADLDYRNTGFLGSMDLMRRTLSFRLRKVPEFSALQNMIYTYIEQCFFPHIVTLNDAQLKDILTSRDLFSVMRVNGYLIEYNGSVYTCGEFYDSELSPKWNDLKLKLQNNPEVAGFVFEESQRVPGVVQALTRANYSFQDAVAQAGLINAVSYVLSAQSVDDYRLLSAYISGRAQEQSKLLWRGLGTFMADTLPKVRNYIIAIAVFFSFMLIPMILLPFFGQTPGSVLVGFAKFIAWAWFWDPMLALLDAGTKIMAVQKTTAWLANQNLDGISIATLAELVNDAEWYPAVAGYIAMAMVPTLSWLFFRGFDAGVAGIAYMFSGLAGGVKEEFSQMTRNIQRDYLGSLTGELNSGTWSWRELYSGNINSLAGIYKTEELVNTYGSNPLGYVQKLSHAQAVLEQQRIGEGLGVEEAAHRLNLTPEGVGRVGGFTRTVETVAPFQVLGEDNFIAKTFTDAQKLLGAYQAWQSFVNEHFGGDSVAASKWMEAYRLLHSRGDLQAFEQYLKQQGLDKYVGMRYGELLNETAKIYREFAAARLLERDPYTHFSAKHSEIHTTLQSKQDVLSLADTLDRAGFGEFADLLRSNWDKWIGADVTFVLTENGIGAFSVRKEGEIISGSRKETYDVSRDIKLSERRDERIDVEGTKKEVYRENITRWEEGDITKLYGGNVFVGNAIETAIGQKSLDPIEKRPHILNLLRDDATRE